MNPRTRHIALVAIIVFGLLFGTAVWSTTADAARTVTVVGPPSAATSP